VTSGALPGPRDRDETSRIVPSSLSLMTTRPWRVHARGHPSARVRGAGCHDQQTAIPALGERDVAVLLAHQRMPGRDGIDLLIEARHRHPDVKGRSGHGTCRRQRCFAGHQRGPRVCLPGQAWEADELMAMVRRAVDARRALRRKSWTAARSATTRAAVLEKLSRSSLAANADSTR
jgi:DNA-binding NarL/FixJ family response regulator